MKTLLTITTVLTLALSGSAFAEGECGGGKCSGKKGDKKEAPKDTYTQTLRF